MCATTVGVLSIAKVVMSIKGKERGLFKSSLLCGPVYQLAPFNFSCVTRIRFMLLI